MMYLIKNIFIILFLFFGASGYTSSFEEISKSIASIIIHNNNYNRLGSGFFISSNLLVTNYHVIQDSKNRIVFFVTPQKIEGAGIVTIIDQKNDLAIIKTVKSNFKALRMNNSQHIKMGDNIFAINSPKARIVILSEGILSIESDSILEITAPLSPGSSGAPVFSKNFEVIGIVKATSFTPGQNIAVPVNKLKSLVRTSKLDVNKTNLEQKGAKSQGSFEDDLKFYIKKQNKTPEDMFHIGMMYFFGGEGLEKDYKKVLHWLQKSARLGFTQAQHNLGVMYMYYGRDMEIPKNNIQAHKWISLYKFQVTGDNAIIADHLLDNLENQMTRKQIEEAKELFQREALQILDFTALKEGKPLNETETKNKLKNRILEQKKNTIDVNKNANILINEDACMKAF